MGFLVMKPFEFLNQLLLVDLSGNYLSLRIFWGLGRGVLRNQGRWGIAKGLVVEEGGVIERREREEGAVVIRKTH
jgi:hypothetical protein